MSLLRAKNVQVGIDATATNNFTLYQPATLGGQVRLGNGNSGSVTDLITIDSAGNVGIGNTSPSSFGALTVMTSNMEVGYLKGTTASQGSRIRIVNDLGNGATILTYGSTYAGGTVAGVGAGGTTITATSNLSIACGTGNSIRFTIGTGNTSDLARLDSAGNFGLGVVPSAWTSTARSIDIGTWTNFSNTANGFGQFGWNNYETAAGVFTYKYNGLSSAYRQVNGIHSWYTAPTGNAGTSNLVVWVGQKYTVSSLGSTTLAQWQAFFSGLSAVPAVGDTVTATAAGVLQGGATVTQQITFTQAMTLDASGNLLVGTTSSLANTKFSFAYAGTSQNGITLANTAASGTPWMINFLWGTSSVGVISSNSTSTSYATSSDYRLKENIQPMQNALDVVQQLNPVTYTWKADGSDGQGFIAHELQAVVPDCVTGEKDAVDADGNPVYQGVDTSFLVGILTKAIQELKAELDDVKSQLANKN